jgi:purine-binding chemotaxis protein CheW
MAIEDEPNTYSEADLRILEARARRLAQPPESPVSGEMLDLVVLVVGVERYGVDVRYVQEVLPFDNVTPLPGVPVFWAGLVNLRGHLYPLLDLSRFLGLPPRPSAGKEGGNAVSGKVVLVAAHGVEVGLLADDVPEVRQVLRSDIGAPLVEAVGPARALMTGVTSDLLTVLNVEALLTDARLTVQAT